MECQAVPVDLAASQGVACNKVAWSAAMGGVRPAVCSGPSCGRLSGAAGQGRIVRARGAARRLRTNQTSPLYGRLGGCRYTPRGGIRAAGWRALRRPDIAGAVPCCARRHPPAMLVVFHVKH